MNNSSVYKKVLSAAAGVVVVALIAAFVYVQFFATTTPSDNTAWQQTLEESTKNAETKTDAPLDATALTEYQRVIRAAQACASAIDIMPSDSALLEYKVIDGTTFITHHCDSFTRVYVISPEGNVTYHVVGPRYYGNVLGMSPQDTFMVMQGCNGGGGCSSRVIDLRNGTEAKFEYRSPVLWTAAEDRMVTVSGFALGHDGVGLRIITTADMNTQRVDLEAFNPDYSTAKEIVLQSLQGDIVSFTVMYYQGTEGRTDMLTYNLTTGQIVKSN